MTQQTDENPELPPPSTPAELHRPAGRRDDPQDKQPLFLDEIRQREVQAVVAVGCSLTTAAKYVGCSRGMLFRARKKNPEFAAAVRRAQATAELELVRRIYDAVGEKNGWRAAAWLLSRRHPERYAARFVGSTTPREIETALSFFALEVAKEISSPEERERVGRRLRRLKTKIAGQLRWETAE